MKKTVYNLCAVTLMLALILVSLFTVGNRCNFYSKQYAKNLTNVDTGMSFDDLMAATDLLLDYLNDDIDSLDMKVKKWGEEKELFDRREKTHMIDVKVLYQTFKKIMYILLAISLTAMVYLRYRDKGDFIKNIHRGFNLALFITAGLCLILTVVFATGFNSFWTLFHEIMFTNDLWLLDPDISTMINMFPLNFWLAMCTETLVRFALLFGMCYLSVKAMNIRKAG